MGRLTSDAVTVEGGMPRTREFSVRRYRSGDVELVADMKGTNPHFLLLHAGGERRTVWHPVMRKLFEHGLGSLAVDQRGHGESSGSTADGIAKFAEDASQLLAACKSPAIAVGASLGGFAIMLALGDLAARAKLAGIVLVDVIPDPDPDRVRAFLRTTTPPLDQSPLVDDILGQAEHLSKACAMVDVPLLLVVAGKGAITASDISRLNNRVDDFDFVRIPDASHLVARDQPDALADALLAFAARVESRS